MLPILRALVGRLYAFYYYFGPLQEPLDAFFCKLASLARLNYGEKIHTDVRTSYRPRLLLCLYELEACNVCRQVREAMCVLDLDYICLPCPREHVVFDPTPKEGRWKMEALAKGQNAELPLLVDPNTEATLSGDNIVPYLWETYGPLLGEIDVTVVEAKNLSERPGNKRGGFSMAMGVQRKVFAEVVLTGCPVPALGAAGPAGLWRSCHRQFGQGCRSHAGRGPPCGTAYRQRDREPTVSPAGLPRHHLQAA